MTPQELMERRLRLARKLSASCEAWHSGRIDRLADALRAVVLEISAGHAQASMATRLSHEKRGARPRVS